MNLIKPGYKILTPISDQGWAELTFIEDVARYCYKSEANNDGDFEKTKKFVKGLISRGHHAMLEHSMLTVAFLTDRGVSHEIVRHRHFSFAQESTRYCNYTKDKFGSELTFIEPYWYDSASYNDKKIFEEQCKATEKTYLYQIDSGLQPQGARAILPNAIKTEIVVTGNYREWRHFLSLRAANSTGKAHPDMNRIACPLLLELHETIPVIFDDVYEMMLQSKDAMKWIEE